MALPTYASRQVFMSAADIHTSANLVSAVDRVLQSASRQIDESFHRHFYPLTEAVTYESPELSVVAAGYGSGFFLGRDLRSLTAATVDGTAQTVGDIDLWPPQYGPPYSWVGLTGQTIVLTGVWGYSADTTPAGALAEALDDSETGVDVTDSSLVGVGDMILADPEQMVVTGSALLDTTADLNDTLTADVADVTVTLDDATQVKAGEVLTFDSERMKTISISGNDLTVVRSWDGSVLAAHSTGINVWAPRTLTVERNAVGTTATTHLTAAPLTRNVPPPPITSLCVAEALVSSQQEQSAYGRTVGSGDSQREARGAGLADARKQASGFKRRRLASV